MESMRKEPWEYRGVVFDLDGVLIDTEPIFEEVARRLLALRGLEPNPRVLEAMMGTPARQALKIFREHHQLNDTVEELSVECSRLFYDVLGADPVRVMAGAVPLLGMLRTKNIPCAIATSSSAVYVERVLKPLGLLPHFQFVLTCDDVQNGKPDPEVYATAAARLGLAPAEVVVLEDSPAGLRAAKAAGARCVAVPHRRVPLDQLTGADAIVPSLAAPEFLSLMGLPE